MFFAALGIAVAVLACREITAPLFAPHTSRYQNGTGTVVVSPANMRGWALYNDQADAPCTDTSVCRLVQGPASPPSGTGSAELATAAASDGVALVLQDYKGTRLDSITDLHYSTYRQTADAGNNLAIALQFNVDYDLTDQSAGYQGRLVYEPYQGVGGNVPRNTWQSWDARAGRWWGTRASVPVNGVLTTNPCVQATPCTWSTLLATFPNVGVHATYGAVILKAGSGWANFRGNVDAFSIGINGATITFDFERSQPVPAQAPASISSVLWDSLLAPTNLMTDSPGRHGTWVRNVMYVLFKPTATQADRQAAIDLINGEVVGGVSEVPGAGPRGEREYIVRIPDALPGDSISGPVLRARATLIGHPAIVWAIPVNMDKNVPYYRKPTDGPGYTVWPTSRDSGTGANWGQVAVNAPFAWGCVTGKEPGISRPAIAVVDGGFHDVNDLKASAGPVQEFTVPSDANQHGLAIASIIGAEGNSNDGITGMLWKANLSLYNMDSLPPKNAGVAWNGYQAYNLERAVRAGARVVNVSWGLDFYRIWNTAVKSPADSAELVDRAYGMVKAIEASRDPVTHRLNTLFVVAAGNHHTDAYWSAFGYLSTLEPYKKNIIIVGAAKHDGGALAKSDSSNGGSTVDIMAPGEGVGVLTTNYLGLEMVELVTGTSIAAPFVVGVAGMLLSNDPSLTPDSVKSLILLGAKVNPRAVYDPYDPGNKKPFLDAYESLRLLSTNPGAPLCGNRLYANGTNLVVQRGSGTETIGSLPTNAFVINAKHGGRRVEAYTYDTTTSSAAFTYSSTGWTRTNMPSYRPPAAVDDGGAFNGTYARTYGYTHGGDTLIDVRVNTDVMRMFVYDTVTWNEQAIGAGTSLPPALNTLSGDCDYQRFNNDTQMWDCFTRYYYYHGSIVTRTVVAGVSPLDASSYVAVGFQTAGELGGPAPYWDCTVASDYGPPARCRDTWHILRTLDSLQLFHVDRVTGKATRLTTRVGANPTRLAVSEDGRELLLSYQEVPGGYASDVKTFGVNDVRWTDYPAIATCVTEPISIVRRVQGDTVGTQLPRLASEAGYSCPVSGTSFGIPTFSPSRIPLVTPRP